MSAPRQTLSAKDWAEVRSLFERCRGLEPLPRRQLLEETTRGRPELRREVESLLAQYKVSDSFLGPPLLNRMVSDGTTLPSEALTDCLPQRLGRYDLIYRLGRGGMAEVFLAKMQGAQGFERLVAIKRILPDVAADSQQKKLFHHEARLNSHLSHANIVHVYDFGEVDGACFLAMEFIDGKNLADLLTVASDRGLPIPLDIALHIVARIAEGLDYAHRRKNDTTGKPLGIVHRDISPKNVMLSFDGHIKIVDFGIAKAAERTNLTRTGTLFGTIAYLSPEAALGRTVDSRSDIFSVGLVLYELLSGRRLFSGDDTFSVLRQVQEWELPAELIEDLPIDEDLKRILRGTLAKLPEERMGSAGQLRTDLDAYLASHFPASVSERLTALLQVLYQDDIPVHQKLLERARSAPDREIAPTWVERPFTERPPSSTPPPPQGSLTIKQWALGLLMMAAAGAATLFLGSRRHRPTESPRASLVTASRDTLLAPHPPEPKLPSPLVTEQPRAPAAPSTVMREEPSSTTERQPATAPTLTTAKVMSDGPCAQFAEHYCPGLQWKQGLRACLQKVREKLSPPCLSKIDSRPPRSRR